MIENTNFNNPNTSGLAETLARMELGSFQYTAMGQAFFMGEMGGINTVLPIRDLVSLGAKKVVTRSDYELEGSDPGNRVISSAHVKKIKRGLRKHAKKLLTGTFTLAIDPDGVHIQKIAEVANGVEIWICRFSIRSGYSIFIVDAQHRNDALTELWNETLEAVRQGLLDAEEVERLLKKSAVPVLIILEGDRDEISRMFVTMASTKPISPSLIAVMDREQFSNQLGLEVAKNTQLLSGAQAADRLAYQTSTATGDNLYAAAAVRGAAATMFIGFRDRTPEMRDENLREYFQSEGLDPDDSETIATAAKEAVTYLDYAYQHIPGWRELRSGDLDPKDFRAKYLQATAAGLYTIAGVICAARLAPGVDPKHVIELMAEKVHWEKDYREKRAGSELEEHPDFEGSLVVNEPLVDEDGSITGFKAGSAGGARTNYEKATRALIDQLIQIDPTLEDMRSDTVQIAMGLKASGKRGRPRRDADAA